MDFFAVVPLAPIGKNHRAAIFPVRYSVLTIHPCVNPTFLWSLHVHTLAGALSPISTRCTFILLVLILFLACFLVNTVVVQRWSVGDVSDVTLHLRSPRLRPGPLMRYRPGPVSPLGHGGGIPRGMHMNSNPRFPRRSVSPPEERDKGWRNGMGFSHPQSRWNLLPLKWRRR